MQTNENNNEGKLDAKHLAVIDIEDIELSNEELKKVNRPLDIYSKLCSFVIAILAVSATLSLYSIFSSSLDFNADIVNLVVGILGAAFITCPLHIYLLDANRNYWDYERKIKIRAAKYNKL